MTADKLFSMKCEQLTTHITGPLMLHLLEVKGSGISYYNVIDKAFFMYYYS